VPVFRVGELVGLEGLVSLLESVGDVLEEDQTKDNVLVLGRIHVPAQLVGSRPELLLESEVRAVGARLLVLLLGLGHPLPPGPSNRIARGGPACGGFTLGLRGQASKKSVEPRAASRAGHPDSIALPVVLQRRHPSRRSGGAHRGSLRVPGPGRRLASRARLYDRQTHLSAPEIDTAAPNADGAKTEGRALGP